MEGFLLIDKPATWTSHDVVGYLRKITRIKKIGHAGTLDPFATGLLIVAIGRNATKRLEEFKNMHKEYVATLMLGAVSDTFDKTGKITVQEKKIVEQIKIENLLKTFIGEQTQIAPMYSAKKIGGQKLYDLARQGIEIERKPHHITISHIQLLSFEYPLVQIKVMCSPGTYIRTLASDIGEKLGTGAYCEELCRTAIGEYIVENALPVQTLTPQIIEKALFLA